MAACTQMVQQLKAMNVTTAVSVWPDVDTQSINYESMSAQGMLIRGADGKPMVSAQGKYYLDAFNPAARQFVFEQFMKGYGAHGIETFWMDATEPQGANIGHWYFQLDDGSTRHDAEIGTSDPSLCTAAAAAAWLRGVCGRDGVGAAIPSNGA